MMVLTRVSTGGLLRSALRNNRMQWEKVNELYAQSNSGKKAQRYDGLAGSTTKLITAENALDRIEQYKTNINVLDKRVQTFDTNMRSIREQLIQFKKTLLSAANDDNAKDFDLVTLGRDLYEDLARFLNHDDDGRYLFGGSQTDRPPVLSFQELSDAMATRIRARGGLDLDQLAPWDLKSPSRSPGGGVRIRSMQVTDFLLRDTEYRTDDSSIPLEQRPAQPAYINAGADERPSLTAFRRHTRAVDFQKLYYQGNRQQLTHRIDDHTVVAQGVTANQGGFEKALAAAWLLASNGGDSGSVAGASTLQSSLVARSSYVPDAAAPLAGAIAYQPGDNDFDILDANGVRLGTADIEAGDASLNQIAAKINAIAGVTAQVVSDDQGARIEIHRDNGEPLFIEDNTAPPRSYPLNRSTRALGLVVGNGQTHRGTDIMLDTKTQIDVAIKLVSDAIGTGGDSSGETLIDLESRIGHAKTNLDETKRRFADTEVVLKRTISELEDVNKLEAATQLSDMAQQLTTAYQATVRVLQLSLADYLR